ncbi:hypothetical protein BS17DRAFT_814829 [Gyrodon lividus]|nr:hypothetical protein BS17DRAFT_814829 [Gyrodon lividus]
MARSQDSFTFTVGKLDAGMAILLGERAHLIEFPSVLLPPGVTTGSIVNIAVHQNIAEERRRDREFLGLQSNILETFGRVSPEPPQLENSQRLASIPNALTNTSTKLSSLSLDTLYTFQLVLRTTAGTFPSNLIRVRTHTIADTSGISVCFGNVGDEALLEDAKVALREMRAKYSDKIQIDTTHFVCTTPAMTPTGANASGGNVSGGPGVEYQRALQLSIPVVQPQWILACLAEKKMVPIAGFYLGVTPPLNYHTQRPQSMSQATLPSSSNGTNTHKTAPNRASMPAPQRSTAGSPPAASKKAFEPTPEEDSDEEAKTENVAPKKPVGGLDSRHKSSGTMDRNFKFPSTPPQSPPVPPIPQISISPPIIQPSSQSSGKPGALALIPEPEADLIPVNIVTPSSVEVPPPPPIEKETRRAVAEDDAEEEVGETVEIDLR